MPTNSAHSSSSPSTGWWNDFFTGVAADAMSRLFSPEQTRLEADFVERHLDAASRRSQTLADPRPKRILDVPCGDARVAVELARRGHSLVGVDLSADGLAHARRRVDAAGADVASRVALERRDMRDLPRGAAFDAAYCFGNSFPYMDDAGNRAFLAAVRAVLAPGGAFALDTGLCAESILTQPLGRTWHEIGDIVMMRATSYDPATARLTTEYGFLAPGSGRVEKRTATYAVYTFRDLVRLFEEAGFRDVSGFSSLAGEPYRLGAPRLYVVAKPGAR